MKSNALEYQYKLKEYELNALQEVTQAINANMPEDSLYKIYHFTLLSNHQVKKLALYVKEENWVCKVNFGTEKNFKNIALPEDISRITQPDVMPEGDIAFSEFETVIPVAHKTTVLAYLFVSGKNKDQGLDIAFIQTLTNIIIVAIENTRFARRQLTQEALRKELEIAGEVQKMLFPKKLPDTSKVKIHATYLPHQSIGGDYYDYIPIDKDSFILCIADVSGKGIPAALLMSNAQASLRVLASQKNDLKSIVRELNKIIMYNAEGEKFITFFIALCNTQTQTLTYINAGHNPPIFKLGNEIIALEKGTTVLGVFDQLPFVHEETLNYNSGSVLVAFTDGITEAANEQEEELGSERLTEIVRAYPDTENLADMHKHILSEVDAFIGKNKYQDDITCISCLFR